jgi:hypothetical protein
LELWRQEKWPRILPFWPMARGKWYCVFISCSWPHNLLVGSFLFISVSSVFGNSSKDSTESSYLVMYLIISSELLIHAVENECFWWCGWRIWLRFM